MKKLVVALTVVALMVGLAMAAGAAYHEVYKWIVTETGNYWEINEEAEMFSKTSTSDQYRWQSAAGVGPNTTEYAAPTEERPIPQIAIKNYTHVFPWIDYHFTETELIWDVFKPGNYMALAFIIDLRANCPVQVHFGGGGFWLPDYFVDGQNGHIEKRLIGLLGESNWIGDKVRQYSLLDMSNNWFSDPPKGSGNVDQDGEDVLDVKLFWHLYEDCDRPDENDVDLDVVPDKDAIDDQGNLLWRDAEDLNCTSALIPDTNTLHEGTFGSPASYRTHLAVYEDILVEACDSEGKYFDRFVITISPDP